MATEHTYHKFNSTEMEEIRQLRCSLLKAHKMESKYPRIEKIAKAIIADIDWSKLGMTEQAVEKLEETKCFMEAVQPAIIAFREELSDLIRSAIHESFSEIREQALDSASTQEMYEAAELMANKYHERSRKRGKGRKSKSAKGTRKPIQNPTSSPHKANTISTPPTQTPTFTEVVRRPSPPKSNNKTQEPVRRRIIPTTRIPENIISPNNHVRRSTTARQTNSANSLPKFSTQTAQTTSRRSFKPSVQTSVTSHFRTVKSSKSIPESSKSCPSFRP